MGVLPLLLIGLLAGTLSGLFGIGGGIIIVPLLVTFGGLTQIMAQGTSVGVLILPVGIFAAIKYYNSGNLDIKSALLIACTMAIGAYLGANVAHYLPPNVLKKLFGILLLAVAGKFLLT